MAKLTFRRGFLRLLLVCTIGYWIWLWGYDPFRFREYAVPRLVSSGIGMEAFGLALFTVGPPLAVLGMIFLVEWLFAGFGIRSSADLPPDTGKVLDAMADALEEAGKPTSNK